MIILRCFVFALLIFSISSTNITNLTNCSAGYYISTNGTASNNRVCSGCLANTFSSSINQYQCTDFTNCQSGEYITTNGTASNTYFHGNFHSMGHVNICISSI